MFVRWYFLDGDLWSYDELDADRRPVRHLERSHTGGAFLAAASLAEASAAGDRAAYADRYGVIPESPFPADPHAEPVLEEVAGADFEQLWRLARDRLEGDVDVQVHVARHPIPDGVTVIVRCVGGPVRIGTRLLRVRGDGDQLDLVVTGIELYGRPARELSPGGTGVLTLSGAGARRVRNGRRLQGRTSPELPGDQ